MRCVLLLRSKKATIKVLEIDDIDKFHINHDHAQQRPERRLGFSVGFLKFVAAKKYFLVNQLPERYIRLAG